MPIAFAQLPGRITAFGPYTQRGTILHTFCVDGIAERIQATLDAMFATPSGGAARYRAIGSKLFISVAEISQVESLNPIDASHGWTPEVDVTIWALCYSEAAGLLALRWVPVYLFVDSAPAMATGREVFGFPKQIGHFDFSAAGANPATARTFKMDGYVLDPWAPNTGARWAPMLAIEPLPAAPPAAPGLLDSLATLAADVAGQFGQLLNPLDMEGMLAKTIGAGLVTMVFLKQFPDIADQTKACYQAVLEAGATVTAFRGAGRTVDSYRLNLTSYDSHPFAAELGIASGWHEVGQGMWVDFDFTMQCGHEVWRAS